MGSSLASFKVRYPLPIRLIPVLCAAIVVYVTPTSLGEWVAFRATGQFSYAACVCLVMYGIAEGIVRRVRFSDTHVSVRNAFGRTFCWSYGDVERLSSLGGEYLELRFRDGRRLRVFAREADIVGLQACLAQRCGTL